MDRQYGGCRLATADEEVRHVGVVRVNDVESVLLGEPREVSDDAELEQEWEVLRRRPPEGDVVDLDPVRDEGLVLFLAVLRREDVDLHLVPQLAGEVVAVGSHAAPHGEELWSEEADLHWAPPASLNLRLTRLRRGSARRNQRRSSLLAMRRPVRIGTNFGVPILRR